MLGSKGLRLYSLPHRSTSNSLSFLHSAAKATPSAPIGESKSATTLTTSKSGTKRASRKATAKLLRPGGESVSKKSHIVKPSSELRDGPLDEFRGVFQGLPSPPRLSPSLFDHDVARDLVRAWGIDKMHDVVVFEAYAAFGGITRALLELKNVKQVVAAGSASQFQSFMTALSQNDDRLTIVPKNPIQWETYGAMEEACKDPILVHPWEEVHPNLFFVAQLEHDRAAENYFFQLITAANNRNWLYKFGRVGMGVIGPNSLFSRITVGKGKPGYQKLAMLTNSLSNFEEIPLLEKPADVPIFQPRTAKASAIKAYKIVPRIDTGIKDYEVLEYVAKNMFILRTHSWEVALAGVAIAAESLIPEITRNGVPKDLKVQQLGTEHWKIIANAFAVWPFRPATLSDDMFVDFKEGGQDR